MPSRSVAAVPVCLILLARAVLANVTLGKVGWYRANHVGAKGGRLMLRRIVTAGVLTGLLVIGVASGVRAQQPGAPAAPASSPSGWTFNLAPYMWFANLNATTNLNLPPAAGGGTVTSTSNIGFDQVLQHLNSAVMVAGDAQYDRFSILTDFMFMDLGGAASRLRSVNFRNHPDIPITGSLQTSGSLNMSAPIWTLAGGYTLLKGDWGNFDVIAGFRYLGIPISIDYTLGLTLTGPRGNSATFGGSGSVSGTANVWNGIGGFRGRIRLGDAGLFIPYYFDIGAGGSNLTWQIASGLGYHMNWGDVSLTYRYLAFEQGSSAVLQHLSVKGPMIMANFTF